MFRFLLELVEESMLYMTAVAREIPPEFDDAEA